MAKDKPPSRGPKIPDDVDAPPAGGKRKPSSQGRKTKTKTKSKQKSGGLDPIVCIGIGAALVPLVRGIVRAMPGRQRVTPVQQGRMPDYAESVQQPCRLLLREFGRKILQSVTGDQHHQVSVHHREIRSIRSAALTESCRTPIITGQRPGPTVPGPGNLRFREPNRSADVL